MKAIYTSVKPCRNTGEWISTVLFEDGAAYTNKFDNKEKAENGLDNYIKNNKIEVNLNETY